MTRAHTVLEASIDVSAVPEHPGGAGRYVVELVRALEEADSCGVQLITRRGDTARWSMSSPHARLREVVPPSRPARLVYEAFRLGPSIARFDPPGVAVHHGPHYTMPRRAPVPCVVTVHDLTMIEHPEWHERTKAMFFAGAIRFAARHAGVVICVSAASAERLHALVEVRCPVIVVPHGVDRGRFSDEAPDDGFDSACLTEIGVRSPFVLYLGTLEPRKGIEDLVTAFDHLAGDDSEINLVLAGARGWGAEPIEGAVSTAHHRNRIIRLGYVPDDMVPSLLRSAAVVAYPSLEEGFGLPALEALSCGAPLVTTSGTAMAEVAGAAAWLVPARDPVALAEALENALTGSTSGDERRALGLAVASSHTWARSAARHVEAYRLASLG